MALYVDRPAVAARHPVAAVSKKPPAKAERYLALIAFLGDLSDQVDEKLKVVSDDSTMREVCEQVKRDLVARAVTVNVARIKAGQ